MEIYNQPPETDIPRALANETADDSPVIFHADLSRTKDVIEADRAAAEVAKNDRPAAHRFTKEQLAFEYLKFPKLDQR